jgi:hypothetical protein
MKGCAGWAGIAVADEKAGLRIGEKSTDCDSETVGRINASAFWLARP